MSTVHFDRWCQVSELRTSAEDVYSYGFDILVSNIIDAEVVEAVEAEWQELGQLKGSAQWEIEK